MNVWRMARLEDVAQVLGGGTPSRTEESYFGGGIAWATPTDVTALDQLYILETKESVTDAGLRNSSTKLMPPGAVLLTSRATIGFTAVSRVPICTNQGFINFICGPDIVSEYLAYWLRTQKAKMIQHAGGTTFKEIARGTIRKFRIPIPPLPEQRRIVDLLSRAEGIVRLRREAEKKAAELIPALFLDMFGDPATNPKGWATRHLDQLCDLVRGSSPRPQGDPRYFGGPVPRLMIADITRDGVYVKPTIDSLTVEGAKKSRPMNKGDVVMAVSGAVGLPAILATDACIHDGFVGFRALNSAVSPEFFYNFLVAYRRHSIRQAVGATFQNLKTDQIREWAVPVPPQQLQERFQATAEELRSLEVQQCAATAKARATFDALLTRCFHQPST